MKGLLLKDLLVAGRQAKTTLLIIVVYLVIFRKNAPVLVGLVSMLGMMTAISSFSHDEAVKWPAYASALPIPRRNIVGAKYVLSFGILAAGVLLSTAVALAVGALAGGAEWVEVISSALGCALVMGFMLCLTLPLMFRYPVEKARAFMLLAMMVPTVLVLAGAEILSARTQTGALTPGLIENLPWGVLCAALVALLALSARISYKISVRFMERKEL